LNLRLVRVPAALDWITCTHLYTVPVLALASESDSFSLATMSNTLENSTDFMANPLMTISGHQGDIYGIAYLPGGERVVTCSYDKTVRIWDVEKGEQEGTSMVHEGHVQCLAVTSDGKKILSGGEDRRIRVWDVETHEQIEQWASHTGDILCIALSPDNQLAASASGSGGDDGKIVIGEMKESGKIKHSIDTGHFVWSLCFSPNGEKLACAIQVDNYGHQEFDIDIHVYDVESGKLVLDSIQGHEDWVSCVLWSVDGSQLFSASE
jgi:WD40 repeat protein